MDSIMALTQYADRAVEVKNGKVYPIELTDKNIDIH